jgi:hypothetical protein
MIRPKRNNHLGAEGGTPNIETWNTTAPRLRRVSQACMRAARHVSARLPNDYAESPKATAPSSSSRPQHSPAVFPQQFCGQPEIREHPRSSAVKVVLRNSRLRKFRFSNIKMFLSGPVGAAYTKGGFRDFHSRFKKGPADNSERGNRCMYENCCIRRRSVRGS